MEELNRKLAEWAGFSIRSVWDTGFQLFKTPQKPSPDGAHYDEEEFEENWYKAISTDYFTSSLDACFKWLVPKLFHKDIMVRTVHSSGTPSFEGYLHRIGHGDYWGVAETPALALCLALEKLIDAEGK